MLYDSNFCYCSTSDVSSYKIAGRYLSRGQYSTRCGFFSLSIQLILIFCLFFSKLPLLSPVFHAWIFIMCLYYYEYKYSSKYLFIYLGGGAGQPGRHWFRVHQPEHVRWKVRRDRVCTGRIFNWLIIYLSLFSCGILNLIQLFWTRGYLDYGLTSNWTN